MSEMNKTVPRSTMLYWREKSQMQKSQIKVLQEILGDLLSWAAELAGDTTDEDQRDFEVSSVERARAVLSASQPAPQPWRPIETAPKDGTVVLVFAEERQGLPAFQCTAAHHKDAGWCVDELREVTHWMPLPTPPQKENSND